MEAPEEQLMNANGDAVEEMDSSQHKLISEDSGGNDVDQETVPHIDANGDDPEEMLQEDGDYKDNPDDETMNEQPDLSHDAEESGSVDTSSANKESISTGSVVTSTPKAPSSGQPKPANVSVIPSKGDNGDSSNYEEGDDSFVVQVDDTMLNDIDSDLLAQEKSGATAQSIKEADTNGEGSEAQEAAADAIDTEANKDTASKDEKEGNATVESGSNTSAKKDQKPTQSSRNLWVSGLSSLTRASDLKTRFSKYGKVVGAKVVANAKNPRARCYGLVTMGTADEATKCIQHIHRTELHGRLVSVERAKTEPAGGKAAKVLPPSSVRSPTKPSSSSRRSPSRGHSSRRGSRHPSSVKEGLKKDDSKTDDAVKETDNKEKDGQSEKKDAADSTAERKSKEKSNAQDKAKRDEQLDKIKAERERRRLINKEIQLRQEERRHQMRLGRERFKQEQRAKRLADEAKDMEREKRKLREMREELERERMKTERLKLETERLQIERERERVLQERRPVKRAMARDDDWSGSKRPVSNRFQADGRQYERKVDRFDRREPERGARYEGWREERPGRNDRFESERDERGYDDHRTSYRDDTTSGRGAQRSEWKSERETMHGDGGSSTMWKGAHKMEAGWNQGGKAQNNWENGGGKKWMDKEVENIIAEKNMKYRKWRQSGTERDLQEYKRVRNLTKTKVKSAKEQTEIQTLAMEVEQDCSDGVWKSAPEMLGNTYTYDFVVQDYSKNAPQSSKEWDIGFNLPHVKASVGFWRGTMRAFLQYRSRDGQESALPVKLKVSVYALNQDGMLENWELGTKEVEISFESATWKNAMNTSWRKGLQKQAFEDQLLLRYEITVIG